MNAGIAAYVILTQNTDVTDIVGVNIFPEVAEQETATPFIVYQLLSVAPEDTHDGPSTLDEVRFEFLCYADSYALAADLGSKVRGALDRVSGTYNGVNVESIQFNDVDIDTIDAPRRFAQVLTFTFRIKRDNVEIAQGTPVTGAKLGDLYDVDTTGVTDGQVIAYDAAAQEWQPADDAGGVTALGQLDDVTLNNTAQGELLKYDGNDWVNDTIDKSDVSLGNVDNTSDADKPISTATQTALNDKADSSDVPTELDDLSDVKIIGAPSAGQSLVYNSGFFQLGQAGATTLGALDDVNTVGAAFGSLLAYNGSTGWDISAAALPTDDIYFHQRYVTESEALRSGATATVELYFACTAQGNGLAEDAESDTPTAGKVINRKIYYSESAFADPDTGTWVEFTTLADDITFANAKAALLEYLKARTGGTVPISLKQTWEEVTAAPAFTGLLNETYGSGAEAAYSTRRLNGNVTDCMVIRRASDSTTTTIGFDGSGNIDESAINTFCSGTTCTVYQWLDQSGNDNTATAASGQEPTIYTGGALVKENGRVALFDGHFQNITGITKSSNWSSFETYKALSTDTNFVTYAGDNNPNSHSVLAYQNISSTAYIRNLGSPSFFQNGTTQSFTTMADAHTKLATDSTILLSLINGNNSTWDAFYLGNYNNGGFTFDGYLQEQIFYTSDKSSVRTDIEENIGDYFTQNTPLLDTYTGAAAAYSLRRLSSSYVGSAVEVYNGSSYADIGFNVFGELDTVALAAHCGSNDGFVSKWYCQSGNSNDAVQATTANMPKIYDGTTGVVTENGKPAVEFDGSNDSLTSSTPPFSGTTNRTSFTVSKANTSTSDDIIYGINSIAGATGTAWQLTAETQLRVSGRIAFNNSAQTIHSLGTLVFDGTTVNDANFYLNGSITTQGTSTGATINTSNNDWAIGNTPTVNTFYDGKQQELIFYANAKSSTDRTGIESNVNTFYSIY